MKNCGDSFYPLSVSYNKAQYNKEREKEKSSMRGVREGGRELGTDLVLPLCLFVCLCYHKKFFLPRVQSLLELVTLGFLLLLTFLLYLYHLSRKGNNFCMRFGSFLIIIIIWFSGKKNIKNNLESL